MKEIRIVMKVHGSTVPLLLDVDAVDVSEVLRGAQHRNNGIVVLIDGTKLPCANVNEIIEGMMMDLEKES